MLMNSSLRRHGSHFSALISYFFQSKVTVGIALNKLPVVNSHEQPLESSHDTQSWMLSDAFELDANIANFVYYGKTRL